MKKEQYLPADRQEIVKKQLVNVAKRFPNNAKVLDIDSAIPPFDIVVGIEKAIPKLSEVPDWEYLNVPRHSFDIALICDNIIESKLLGFHYQQIHEALRPDGILLVHCLNSQRYPNDFYYWKFTYRIADLLQHASINEFTLEQCLYTGNYPIALGCKVKVSNFREYVTLLFSKTP